MSGLTATERVSNHDDAASPSTPTLDPAVQLLNRNFVLLWQGHLVSQLGNQAYFVAVMYWTMEATGSSILMGVVMMSSTLPSVLLGPVAGAFVDRHSRKAIIVASDVLRGLTIVGLAWLVHARPDPTAVIPALIVVGVLGGMIAAVFNPAAGAVIPDLVPTRRIASANSLMQLSSQGSTVLGQAVGGVLYRTLGAPVLFLVDGVSFLISAISEAWIKIPQARPQARQTLRSALHEYLRDTVEGLAYVRNERGMRVFILLAAGLNFFFMPVFILLPFYVRDTLSAGAAWYGFLLSGLSAGSIAGIALAGVLRLRGDRRARALVTAFLLVPVGMVALGSITVSILALAVMFVMGLFTGAINVLVLSLIQVATPRELRGRVLALTLALAGGATPLGMLLGGLLGEWTGMNLPVVFGACGIAALVVSAVGTAHPACRTFLALDFATVAPGDSSSQPIVNRSP